MNYNNLNLIKILKIKEYFSISHSLLYPKNINELQNETKLDYGKLMKLLKTMEISGIVKKNENDFSLTEIGKKIFQKTIGMEFLFSNSNYFLSHSIKEIPDFLIQQIDSFSNCEIIDSVWPVTKKMERFANEAQGFVSCIFSEPPFLLANPLYERIQSGIKLKLLFGRNSKLPDCNDLVEKLQLNKPKSDSLFEKRLCEKVVTDLVVSDKGGCLMLSDKNYKSDMTFAISGTDEDFVRWCQDFFEYKWDQGEPFARIRI